MNTLTTIEKREYLKETQSRGIPQTNLGKGMPNKQPRKEDVLNILNEYGIPLNKLIGWLPNYEKPKEHTNRLR